MIRCPAQGTSITTTRLGRPLLPCSELGHARCVGRGLVHDEIPVAEWSEIQVSISGSFSRLAACPFLPMILDWSIDLKTGPKTEPRTIPTPESHDRQSSQPTTYLVCPSSENRSVCPARLRFGRERCSWGQAPIGRCHVLCSII